MTEVALRGLLAGAAVREELLARRDELRSSVSAPEGLRVATGGADPVTYRLLGMSGGPAPVSACRAPRGARR